MTHIETILDEPHFVVVNKPAGLFSQAAEHIPCLQKSLQEQLRRAGHEGNPFVGLPHRLDRGTTGVMLVAKNQRALKRFGQQFQSRKVGKFYLGVVEGDLEGGIHDWEDMVRKIDGQAKAEIVKDESEGRTAQLRAQKLMSHDGLSLVLFRLITGRMHQIRLQAAERGYPIVGDELYGSQVKFGNSISGADGHEVPAIGLHALRLEFRHPQNARLTCATANVPDSWQHLNTVLAGAIEETIEKSQTQNDVPWNL